MIQFNLKNGMKDSEIYSELMGKIQGESLEQVQAFYYPKDNPTITKPEPLHQVIKSNGKYAIIKKNWDVMGFTKYYISGINDEGTYFVHELPKYADVEKLSLEEILADINLQESEFERIQGDLLIKFYPKKTITVSTSSEVRYKIVKGAGMFGFLKPKKVIDEISLFPEVINLGDKVKKEIGLQWDIYYNRFTDSMSIFNNHKLSVEKGVIFEQIDDLCYLAFGDSLRLTHNQHGLESIKIPKEYYALIIPQKSGRIGKARGTD